ncbi:ABC transporter substrate-binding protein [Clostridium bowmanii]|uniref:ABC transporter substrate-binding protein n=1 Tax=Clostridium bowmanii TaxID=132925 RepID=UPI001C0D3346|nr:ABC transporter substrate-binding protein [Clostridium bowmanii]MBU3190230.1 ABC transporter substrate-binding protein [Clostridium bowmanii]MCA1074795.1 ABC transporter substrate-binding protein [Clostridium bowmanii]
MKKILALMIVTLLVLTGCAVKNKTSDVVDTNKPKKESSTNSKIEFVDDGGKKIVLSKPAKKIISLYSVHTENLYSLGLDSEIIGVGTSDTYPKAVLSKTQYSVKDDPELVIAAKPDVVLIRSTIAQQHPDYIKAIQGAGITVVSLYCSEFDQFGKYITRLGMLVGKESEAKALITQFNSGVAEIQKNVEKIDNKRVAYFESTGEKIKTVTPNSFAGRALTIVGLENIATDVKASKSSTIVEYGEESLLSKSNAIEFYIAQKGAMNKSVSIHEIKKRPGYSGIKAIKDNNIIIIDEKLISSATMRYLVGLKELQTKIYGEITK